MVAVSRPALVATILTADEQSRVESAGDGHFRPLHAKSIREARRVIRERPVTTVLVSPHRVPDHDIPGVERLVRDFPGIPAVALMTRPDPDAPRRLLMLGASGVRHLVDATRRDGWQQLREIVAQPSPIRRRIMLRVMPALGPVTPGTVRFFETMVVVAPFTGTVRALTSELRVTGSTFMSRFFRAGLPSPKRYLSGLRLVHAAALFEIPGLSISDVAYRLEYSSPQSFGRHVRADAGVTAGEFRRRFSFDRMLDDFVDRLITPFRARLRTFRPL